MIQRDHNAKTKSDRQYFDVSFKHYDNVYVDKAHRSKDGKEYPTIAPADIFKKESITSKMTETAS